jgi:hypothetical protein
MHCCINSINLSLLNIQKTYHFKILLNIFFEYDLWIFILQYVKISSIHVNIVVFPTKKIKHSSNL